jgi:predicted glycosyltransferase
MPSVVLICEVNVGMGHITRMLILAAALSRRFRVFLIVVTGESLHIDAPPGVEVHIVTRPEITVYRGIAARMLDIVREAKPSAAIVEYFPFGRHPSVFYMLTFFKGLAALSGGKVRILCSIRDIQDCKLQALKAESVVRLLNENFHGILIHSDPSLVRLEDSFTASSQVRIPVYYTNYVSRHAPAGARPSQRSNTILVSAGGGRGGEALLRCAATAAKAGLLRGYHVRVLAGKLLLEADWNDLVERCSAPGEPVDLLRWVPDLFAELNAAAVSVSRCGYNTTLDLLASRVPALVVPFATPTEDEQMRRANILSRMGVLRMLNEACMTPESLAVAVIETIHFHPAPITAKLDGAERTCEILSKLTAEDRGAAVAG